MSRKLKIGLVTGSLFSLYAVAIWFLSSVLGHGTGDRWVLRGSLWLLGLIAGGATAAYFAKRPAAAPKATGDETAEIDAAFVALRSKLAASSLGRRSKVGRLPVVLLVGPEGSAKTTSIMKSGLDPELLAGEVFRGDAIIPTRGVNAWISQGILFVEAGGRLSSDSGRWARLVHHLLPDRLRAALSSGVQAPRVAVVCLSCEDLLRPDATDAIPASGRALKGRLAEIAQRLGIHLPVYVVFTKADRIPHFPDYVRNFGREEVRDILGATIQIGRIPADSYSENAHKTLESELQRLFSSLAAKRLKFLPRENQTDIAAGAYEFPRELRKIIPVATQFLVELCRPSQLEVSPFLRGFYFTGVRPVVVGEQGYEPIAPATAMGQQVPVGATSVFMPGRAQIQSPRLVPAAAAGASGRKVPQWVFLDRLFPDVILADQVAMGMTRGGRRVDLMRRVALALVLIASGVAILGFSLSYAGNGSLERASREAIRAASAFQVTRGAAPSIGDLRRLETLGATLDTVAGYERHGPPLRLQWGLYAGSALFPALRRSYFQGFDRLLFAATRDSMIAELRALPESPDTKSDYGSTYNTLKAYLITVLHPEKSTEAFLGPALMSHWSPGRIADPSRTDLARRQFDRYARELAIDNPYVTSLDEAAAARARAFLKQSTGTELIYRSMLAEAGAAAPPVQFERNYPAAAGLIRDPYVVPGVYTKAGWNAMEGAFKNVERYFKGEEWVVGSGAPVPTDRAKIGAEIRALYTSDYIAQWRSFLNAASVVRFAGVPDAARKLQTLSSNQSPLLALLALVSRNTAVDTVLVGPAFQPVHSVTPPGDTAKYIGPANEAYINAMVGLQASLEQITKAPPDQSDAAVAQAESNASQAKLASKQLANKFQLDKEGRVHVTVQKLMEDPILFAEGLLQSVGPAQLNGKGQAFCAPFQRLLNQYPFNSYSALMAPMDEVAAQLQPGSGALWTFVDGQMSNYIVRQGPRFAEKPGSPVRISPAFIDFLNRAAEFSTSFYHGDSPTPSLTFSMRAVLSDVVPSLTVTVDGRPAKFTRTSTASKPVTWTGSPTGQASVSGTIGDREREIYTFQGAWAIFKLFGKAQWFPGDGFYRVEWNAAETTGTPVRAVFDVTLPTAKPVLQPNFFAGVSCSGRITR
ncbi:MAG TPA: ImcF-related family protein [Gemmatimonadales bacterium]